MSRVLFEDASVSLPYVFCWWIWALLGLFVIPTVLVGMARTKVPNVESGGDGGEGGSKKRKSLAIKSSGHGSKKKKTGPEPTLESRIAFWHKKFDLLDKKGLSEEEKRWEEEVRIKKVSCERELEYNLMDNPAYIALERKNLHTSMRRRMEYDLDVVREFYAQMVVNRVELEIAARIGGKMVLVTPASIATYLGYTRPDPEGVLLGKRPIVHIYDRSDMAAEMCTVSRAWEKGNIGVGELKPHYRLLAKILGANIYPRGNFKRPGLRECELLLACFHHDDTVDYALWIFHEIGDFTGAVSPRLSLPYPVMITELARQAGVPIGVLTEGRPGSIAVKTLKKTVAQTAARQSIPTFADDFQPDSSLGPSARREQWNKAIFSRQTTLIRAHEELVRERAEDRRAMRDLQHQMGFLIEVVAAQSGRTYVPRPATPPEPTPLVPTGPPEPRPQPTEPEEEGLMDESTSEESESGSEPDVQQQAESGTQGGDDSDGGSRAGDPDYQG